MNQVLIDIENGKFTDLELVTILELTIYKLNVLSISDMARKESKSPNGVRKSKRYRKIKFGNTVLCTDKLRDVDSSIDFL